MKPFPKISLAFCIICYLMGCNSHAVKNSAKIRFEVTEHDFGQLNFKGNGNYSFGFANSGKTPLIISNVKTSCGCTVPQWPKKPLKPGGKGEIKISYDTSTPGMFNKTIAVYYNGENSPIRLAIKGSVNYPPSMPEK